MQLQTLLKNIVECSLDENREIKGLSLNSKDLKPQMAFLAIKGQQTDGRLFIQDAIRKNAAVVFAQAEGLEQFVDMSKVNQSPIPIISVPELQKKIGLIAKQFYQSDSSIPMPITVGITGTNGKSTCCFLMVQALHRLKSVGGLIGTLGYGLFSNTAGTLTTNSQKNTTPDAVTVHRNLAELAQDGAKVIAMEVSSHGLDQNRVQGVDFTSAIFTNLSQDHLDYHVNMDAYLKAKCKLFQLNNLQRVIINEDDPVREKILKSVRKNVSIYLYSLSAPKHSRRHYPIDAQFVYAKNYELTHNGIHAEIVTPWGTGELRSTLLGVFNLSNLLAVLTELCAQGFSLNKVLTALSGAQGAPGRMQRMRRGDQPEVIIDYAHTPDALAKALLAAKQHCKRRLWCVFGCGGDRDPEKRKLMGQVAAQYADKIIITNDNPRYENPQKIIEDIMSGVHIEKHKKVLIETDRKSAIYQALTRALAVDTILIAGKGHEDIQDFGRQKIAFNDKKCVEEIFAKGSL